MAFAFRCISLYILVIGLHGNKAGCLIGFTNSTKSFPNTPRLITLKPPFTTVLWFQWNFTQGIDRSVLFTPTWLFPRHQAPLLRCHLSCFQAADSLAPFKKTAGLQSPDVSCRLNRRLWSLSESWFMSCESGKKSLSILILLPPPFFLNKNFLTVYLGKNPFQLHMKCHAEPWRCFPKTEMYCFLICYLLL